MKNRPMLGLLIALLAKLFADWVRLKEYSSYQVAECVDADVIQQLTC